MPQSPVSFLLLAEIKGIDTTSPDVGGDGDESLSGDAEGGDAKRKRAFDPYTAGGNAYTGSSGDTGSGNIVNEADDDAEITNTGPGVSKCRLFVFSGPSVTIENLLQTLATKLATLPRVTLKAVAVTAKALVATHILALLDLRAAETPSTPPVLSTTQEEQVSLTLTILL